MYAKNDKLLSIKAENNVRFKETELSKTSDAWLRITLEAKSRYGAFFVVSPWTQGETFAHDAIERLAAEFYNTRP